ncbi:MAG: hypothetical protein R2789_16860 [Microthrixaceae bacterium]
MEAHQLRGGGVAAAMIATAVGFALRDGGSAEFAAGVGGFAPGSPEAIVDALPAEPVDPHDVELVASVRSFDSCDALVDDLRRVGAAHVGSQGSEQLSGGLSTERTAASRRSAPARSCHRLRPSQAPKGAPEGTRRSAPTSSSRVSMNLTP